MNDFPQIGLGTWKLRGKAGQEAIEKALEIGYRHIDTADYYQNHDIVGEAVKNSGLKRQDLFIVTKIMPLLSPQRISDAGQRFLEELQIDFIDLLLVHWPDSNPINVVLANFRKLQEKGITKKIGVSNFSLTQMEEAISGGFDIYNHQFEIFPGKFNEELVSYCQRQKVRVTAYSPFDQGRLIKNPNIKRISEEARVSSAQVILSWLLGKGIVVIPKASKIGHLSENFLSDKVKLSREVVKALDNFGPKPRLRLLKLIE